MQSANISQGIEKAIAMETAGQKYYMKCAAGTLHPIGRRMFESFAKECCANHDRLERLYETYYRRDYDEYKKRHPENPGCFELGHLPGSIDNKDSILEALAQASKSEEGSKEHFNKLATATPNKTLKRYYSGIAEEKTRHMQIMHTQSAYIQSTGMYTEYK
jgi:rubrerythrin